MIYLPKMLRGKEDKKKYKIKFKYRLAAVIL